MAFLIEQMELRPIDCFLEKIRTCWTVSLSVKKMGARPIDRSYNNHNFLVFWLSFKHYNSQIFEFLTIRKSKNMSNEGDTTFRGDTTLGLQGYKQEIALFISVLELYPERHTIYCCNQEQGAKFCLQDITICKPLNKQISFHFHSKISCFLV